MTAVKSLEISSESSGTAVPGVVTAGVDGTTAGVDATAATAATTESSGFTDFDLGGIIHCIMAFI
jgi:hypothetical protein